MLTQDRLYPTKVNVYANKLAYTYVKRGLQISTEKYVPEKITLCYNNIQRGERIFEIVNCSFVVQADIYNEIQPNWWNRLCELVDRSKELCIIQKVVSSLIFHEHVFQ